MPKIFQRPHKNPPAPPSPTYLMYDPLNMLKKRGPRAEPLVPKTITMHICNK